MIAIENPSIRLHKMSNTGETGTDAEKHDRTIHSGQFMISRVHDPNIDEDDDDSDDDDVKPTVDKGYSFQEASKETADTYKFGDRSSHTLAIDASLTKLFQCMTLAYSGKITSPRWKTFRGLHLTMKDKVRLNNIIWREWCMQYIYSRRPIICQFASPLSDDIHTKPEAIVLEGKYWKRRLDTVTAEYKKWRKFFKVRLLRRISSDKTNVQSNVELLSRLADVTVAPSQQVSATDLILNSSADFMDIDFSSDTLFNSLNQGFVFPNPREISGVGVADLMQPGLLPLQPNLDDFMDTYDPIHEMLNIRSQNNSSSMQFSGSQTNDIFSSRQSPLTSDTVPDGVNLQSSQSLPQNLDVIQQPGNTNGNILGSLLSGLLNNSSLSQQPDQGAQHILAQLQTPPSNLSMPVTFDLENTPSEVVDNKLNPGVTNTGLSPLQQALLGKNPVLKMSESSSVGKSQSAPSLSAQLSKQTPVKKDVFAVPKKPSSVRKPRTIAPATTSPITVPNVSTPSQQSTYLAQLLTHGTYKGAVITVKKETATTQGISSAPSSLTNVQPNITSTPNSNLIMTPMLSDFPTSVLLQAASQALGTNTAKAKDALSVVSSGQVTDVLSSVQTQPSISTPSKSPESPLDTSLPLSLHSPSMHSPFSEDSPNKKECGESRSDQTFRQKSHISAEQKRRCNIKTGFDLLHTLIPSLNQTPTAKVSKAAMLQKTAEYCKKLKAERSQMQNEAEILRQEIESLNSQISQCQSQLPATGAPVTRQRVDQMKEMFEEYVKNRTLGNWKFWIFSTIIRDLFDSFNNMVSTASMDELCRTTLAWMDQHCSLVALRPAVLNALRRLSTTTSILSDPSKMPQQAAEAVIKGNSKNMPNL